MESRIKSLEIEPNIIRDVEVLRFNFNGYFNKDDAQAGIEEWREIFSNMNGEKAVLIWDAREMSNYETKARLVWQQAIKELGKQIDSIWLIANSKIIRAGAKAMSLFTKFKIHAVDSEDQIKIKNRN